MMNEKLDLLFNRCPVIPVAVIRSLDEVLPMLNALQKGGVTTVEITFRTSCAADAIRLASKQFPDMIIGAGTILNRAQAEEALEAGASFLVSPGLSQEVAELCAEKNIPYLPGCVTPTEIMQAISLGLFVVKFFPADVYGGLSAIKALSAPFGSIRFMPTGGVDFSNLKEFLACDAVAAVGGSFILKGDIEENCRKLSTILADRKEDTK